MFDPPNRCSINQKEMIGKINNGSSIFGAINYNQDNVKEGLARVILQHKMIENYSDNQSLDLHFALRSFESYLSANRKTEKPVVHISLNPDPKDQLTDEQYSQLAQDYMEKMGFGNQPFIVYKHEDIDRHHLHIVTVRVDETGRKISDSYEKLRSMDACRELEVKYGLHPALKKDREFGENIIRKVDYECGDVKRQIANTIRSLVQTYKFQSLGEYSALLSCYNIDVKHVKGERFDKQFNGIVYAAKNNQGEIVSNPFKSSLFGKTYGFEGLTKIMKNNTEILKTKNMTSRSKAIISTAMRTIKTKDDFEKALRSKGMDVVFRSNEQGRIYGVTFIDHENRVVLNGSRLGKEFSANVFHGLFNEGKSLQQMMPAMKNAPYQQPTSPSQSQLQERVTASEQKPIQDYRNTAEPAKTFDTSAMEELFGILEIKPHGEDYEEIAFARKMRKKKRHLKRHL